MLSASLRLRSLINDQDSLDLSKDWIELDIEDPPTLLIYNRDLAINILKSPNFETYNLVSHWRAVVQGREKEDSCGVGIPTIESLFKKTPFFLHGQHHRDVRKYVISTYKKVERKLEVWLGDYTRGFFGMVDRDRQYCPTAFVSSFIASVFNRLIIEEVGGQEEDYPPFSVPNQTLFLFFPRKLAIKAYEDNLKKLMSVLEVKLAATGGDDHEKWALASILVMGQEPLFGGLVYGLLRSPNSGLKWDAKTLLRESAPVSLLGRKVIADTRIGNLDLRKNQSLHIAPFLVNEKNLRSITSNDEKFACAPSGNLEEDLALNSNSQTLEFGLGPHLCAGRNITLAITQSFLDGLEYHGEVRFNKENIYLYRDFNLSPKPVSLSV